MAIKRITPAVLAALYKAIEDEDNPKDFDYVSFDYLEGYFIDHLFSSDQSLEIWVKADLVDKIYLGPDSPDDDPEGNLEVDQYPDLNKGKDAK